MKDGAAAEDAGWMLPRGRHAEETYVIVALARQQLLQFGRIQRLEVSRFHFAPRVCTTQGTCAHEARKALSRRPPLCATPLCGLPCCVAVSRRFTFLFAPTGTGTK